MFDIVHEENVARPSQWSKTLVVLMLLLVAALVFSYLGAFAVTGALLNADLIDKWPANHDPRPRWMMLAFGSMSGAFTLVAGMMKLATMRQLKRMDEMVDAEG